MPGIIKNELRAILRRSNEMKSNEQLLAEGKQLADEMRSTTLDRIPSYHHYYFDMPEVLKKRVDDYKEVYDATKIEAIKILQQLYEIEGKFNCAYRLHHDVASYLTFDRMAVEFERLRSEAAVNGYAPRAADLPPIQSVAKEYNVVMEDRYQYKERIRDCSQLPGMTRLSIVCCKSCGAALAPHRSITNYFYMDDDVILVADTIKTINIAWDDGLAKCVRCAGRVGQFTRMNCTCIEMKRCQLIEDKHVYDCDELFDGKSDAARLNEIPLY